MIGSEGQQGIGGTVDRIQALSEGQCRIAERAEAFARRRTEGEGETDENPLEEDDAHADERQEQLVENVFPIDETAVEECQCGRHQQDQRGRCHHPGVVSLVQLEHGLSSVVHGGHFLLE